MVFTNTTTSASATTSATTSGQTSYIFNLALLALCADQTQHFSGFLENLDQLLGPDTIYTEDQSVQIGSNKRILDVDPTQHLFSSNLNQCYMAETSTSTNPTLQTGRSPSQFSDKEGLFTVPPESIQFKPVGSSVDTCASADSNQQQPRKRQRR
ncbi:hypothetical protein F2Q68_00024659 [Brassica cretica]|uniref:Uncharacterized protein n=1 Tax=Brassica cretica TaxID=69181 RepID=A0A8S9IEZ8_BRACR|nr:hypothetical protein F2Q68_00024659 [Brassica cretica]